MEKKEKRKRKEKEKKKKSNPLEKVYIIYVGSLALSLFHPSYPILSP